MLYSYSIYKDALAGAKSNAKLPNFPTFEQDMKAFLRPFRPFQFTILLFSGWILSTGCGPAAGLITSDLEDDELYLARGEAFTTDAEYLAFAMRQTGLNPDGTPSAQNANEDDYYDPERANRSINDVRYSPNFGLGAPGFGGWGPSWGSSWGANGLMPSTYFGMGTGWGSPWNSGWGGSPYGGYGYNPWMGSGWGPAYGYGGYPYGYNNWNTGNGGWWGSTASDGFGSGSGVISGLRLPLLSNTGNNSSYGENGLYAKPRSLANPGEPHPGEVRPGALVDESGARNGDGGPQPSHNASGTTFPRLMDTPSMPQEFREPRAPTPRFNVEPSRYNPPAATPSRNHGNNSRPNNSPSRPSTSPSRSSGSSTPSRGSNGRRP